MNENNSDKLSLPQALDLIKDREKESFCLEKVNLAELQRLTGITRAKLRRLKENKFKEKRQFFRKPRYNNDMQGRQF